MYITKRTNVIKRTSVFQRWFNQIDSLYQSNNYNTQVELIKNIFKNHLSFSHSYVLCCQNLFDKEPLDLLNVINWLDINKELSRSNIHIIESKIKQ